MSPFKRAFDIVVATLGLVALSPVLAIVAIAIILEDGAPVLFVQKRIGRHGRPFRVIKFRKLRNDPGGRGPVIVLQDDERYTRVGRLLDRTKINELPQLVNVIRGDMSIVGPRPEMPDFAHCYRGRHRRLLDITPGIFGPSQTAFRNETALYPPDEDRTAFYERVLFREKADIDLAYYPNARVIDDVYWVVRSLFAVFAEYRTPDDAIAGTETGSARGTSGTP